ncbi:MAG: polymer-forming cytoskeletal protein [Treponema sp.]|jgi:cytoskeletal protein CcmA (bactofilin family)|nr:polymer-forming cytoskeletal protein [Treponema sp.]
MALDRAKDFSINTIIGPNTNLSGDIEAGGFTRIDGSIRGDVKVKGRIIIGERARIKGNVTGTNITAGGVICGNIISDGHLIIHSTGIVIGDIVTRRIQADDGCFINGKIIVCPTEESWVKSMSEYRDAQGIKSTLPVFRNSNG